MKRITHLYYEHDKRRIVDQDGDIVTAKKARKVWFAGTLTDYNLAFHQLLTYEFDMEKVEAYYRALDEKTALNPFAKEL